MALPRLVQCELAVPHVVMHQLCKLVTAGSKSWAIPLKGIPRRRLAWRARRPPPRLTSCATTTQGKLLAELQQLEASHLAAFESVHGAF